MRPHSILTYSPRARPTSWRLVFQSSRWLRHQHTEDSNLWDWGRHPRRSEDQGSGMKLPQRCRVTIRPSALSTARALPTLALLTWYCSHSFVTDGRAAKATAMATHKPKASARPTPTSPAYNLAGYHSAVNGPEAQAFVSSLRKLRADIRAPDYTATAADAPRLTIAASNWLVLLEQTNPPPSYGPAKLAYMDAATMARQAAGTIQQGLGSADLTALQRGADQLARARLLLHKANAPPASP